MTDYKKLNDDELELTSKLIIKKEDLLNNQARLQKELNEIDTLLDMLK